MEIGKENPRLTHFLLALLALFLVSCNCCCPTDKYGCCYQCDGRRPQVFQNMCDRNYFIDYNFECAEEEYPCDDDEESDRRDLTEEDFIPSPIHADTYKLQKGDILKISIYGEPDTLAEKSVIAPDGNLYYLVLKGFKAEGLTLPELKTALEERLSTFYIAPQVTIAPVFLAGLNYKVLGRVNKP
ncbi:MAG: polysaccharide biosynthesis/export family protein [Parachlamydiaceae bacterium]